VLADPATNQLFSLVWQARWRVLIMAPISLLLPFGAYALDPVGSILRPAVVSGVFGLMAVAYLVLVPARPDREFLGRSPWREAPATVVGATRIELDDPLVPAVRAMSMPSPYRAVVARTGRIWVTGPDRRGRVAVRVEGSRVIHPVRPLDRGRSRQAVHRDQATVTHRTARWMATTPVAMVLAMTGVYGLFSSITVTRLVSFVFVVGSMTVLWCAMVGHRFAWCRLPRLIRAGEWARVDVQVSPWDARRDLTVDAHGLIRLADGTVRSIRMRAATVDLLATIAETGVLWVAGEPTPGRTVAVGFPGYPLLASARVS
jgi:hypothetical protein